MLKVLFFWIVLINVACAQVVKPDESLQEQIVPESFTFSGNATAAFTFASASRKSDSSIVFPSTCIQSHRSTKCGEVNRPHLIRAAFNIAEAYAHTEPLPLVPAT